MSCEDSLSQSILEPNEVLTKQSQSSILLLDEVESLQNEILKDIDEQFSEPLGAKLSRIKEILQNVNKELAAEKQTLSCWKSSMSQSFSQMEDNLPAGEIKERAKKLMLHQKRLLKAFQLQSSIAEKIRRKNREKETKMERNTSSIAKDQLNDLPQSFTITGRTLLDESSLLSEKQDRESAKPTLQPAVTTNTTHCISIGINSLIDIMKNSSSRENHMISATPNQNMKMSRDRNCGVSNVGKDHHTLVLGTSATALARKFPEEVQQAATEGSKKFPMKRKRSDKKPKQSPIKDKVIDSSTTVSTKKPSEGTINNITYDQHSTCSGLPLLSGTKTTSESDKGVLDMSKLKFIVMPKKEEFLDGSKILPIGFWNTDLDEANDINNEFLKIIDFC